MALKFNLFLKSLIFIILFGLITFCSILISKPVQKISFLETSFRPLAKRNPNDTGKIFFLETSFRSDLQGFTMNLRQACSIESAAKMNPERAVEVLFATKLSPENREFHLNFSISFCQLNDEIPGTRKMNFILDKLENSYENLFLKSIDLLEFSERTPLEGLMKSGKVLKSKYLMEHLADVLRLLTLWKFGGTYLDLDVIVKDPIESIGQNFACEESSSTVANGLLNFDIEGEASKILDECVK
jgi:lactosylceramide 4-alpha-galactosyltransferase